MELASVVVHNLSRIQKYQNIQGVVFKIYKLTVTSIF